MQELIREEGRGMSMCFRERSILLLGLLFFICISCEDSTQNTSSTKPLIVCTTGMIADAVQTVAGDSFEVVALMGPGVDPHLYKATQGDLKRLQQANLIFYNGLHLEGKMGEVLEKLGRLKPVKAVASGIAEQQLLKSATFADAYDPHIWFDVSMWSRVVRSINQVLSELYPEHKDTFQKHTEIYQKELQELDQWVTQTIAAIPDSQRVLITAHDAFEYFGRAYQIEVKGLQGISTISEFGLRDVTELVNFISQRKIKAVFVESSVPRKSLEAVVEGCKQNGHEVTIGGTLFSDAMGEAGTPEGHYIGMVKANVQTISQALK